MGVAGLRSWHVGWRHAATWMRDYRELSSRKLKATDNKLGITYACCCPGPAVSRLRRRGHAGGVRWGALGDHDAGVLCPVRRLWPHPLPVSHAEDIKSRRHVGLSHYIRRRDSPPAPSFPLPEDAISPNLCAGVGVCETFFPRGCWGCKTGGRTFKGRPSSSAVRPAFVGSQAHEFWHGYLAAVDGESASS